MHPHETVENMGARDSHASAPMFLMSSDRFKFSRENTVQHPEPDCSLDCICFEKEATLNTKNDQLPSVWVTYRHQVYFGGVNGG